jgi:hypothetical protein
MKSVKDDCYRLFQQIVVKRDKFCSKPGCSELSTAGHHVFGRKNMGTAFNPETGLGLCNYHHDGWARESPEEVRDVLERRLGKCKFLELYQLSHTVCKLTHFHFLKIREMLKQLL